MNAPGTSPPPARTLDPREAGQCLGRLAAVEQHVLRIQGARLPDLESWSLKQQVIHHLYADAGHTQALLTRRRELPGGTRQLPTLGTKLHAAIESCLVATGDDGFCTALYLGIKPLLVQAYRHYLEQTVPFADQRSRQTVEGVIADEERQIAWAERIVTWAPERREGVERQVRDEARWAQRRLTEAGGLLGESTHPGTSPPVAPHYTAVQNARRDPRQKTALHFDPSEITRDPIQQLVATQFAAFFREMQATETLAALLCEVPDALPWEFFADTARHCWDEIRHCQVGQDRLQRLGVDIWSVPAPTRNYDIRARMPLLERYAYLTQVEEASSFAAKQKHEATFRGAGDHLSAHLVAFDIADERRHVAFGTKWVPELQRLQGDRRSLPTLVEDATRLRRAIAQGLRDPLDVGY